MEGERPPAVIDGPQALHPDRAFRLAARARLRRLVRHDPRPGHGLTRAADPHCFANLRASYRHHFTHRFGHFRADERTATVRSHCSWHGNLISRCERLGLDLYDQFDGVIVADGLHCEGCAVPLDRVQAALVWLYAVGQVPHKAFWKGIDPADSGAGSIGLEVSGLWLLDEGATERIRVRWPELSARYAVALRSPPADTPRGSTGPIVSTGLLLYLDTERALPIAVIDPLSDQWTAVEVDNRRAYDLEPWETLFLLRP